MSLINSAEIKPAGRGSPALGISLAGHIAAFFALMYAPQIDLPARGKSEYRQAIEGKEAKLVWYKFRELPDVTPRAKADPRPLKALERARQQIVSSPKNAPRREQLVVSPSPELPDPAPLESPNLLALRLPVPQLSAPKPFVTPPDIQRPPAPEIQLPSDAPELVMHAVTAPELPQSSAIHRRFVPPPAIARAVPRNLAPPPDAPALPVSPQSNQPTALSYSFKSPPRPFTAPPTPAASGPKRIEVAAPPLLAADGSALTPDMLRSSSSNLNVAIVGLNPADKARPVTANSSPGAFSAAPKLRPDGADAAGDKGLTVPDLFVRGAARDPKPNLVAQSWAAPTSSETLREAMRSTEPRMAVRTGAPEPVRSAGPAALRVSGGPDPRFNGREVYMMAIQMPNLTSYSGSWLMWYSDRTAREMGAVGPLSPPVAHRKVDPKYVASAVAEKIEGKVQLACVIGKDGHVSNVEVVRGIDDRLNLSAEEALEKWEFTPASRGGQPVEVDVLVEIPFKLVPPRPTLF